MRKKNFLLKKNVQFSESKDDNTKISHYMGIVLFL